MPQFTFVVDCMGTASCKEIRKDMILKGFDVKDAENTWLGDHIGVKKFPSKKIAEKEANQLIKKYHNKLYQVTVKSE